MNPATLRVPALRMVTSTPVLPSILLGMAGSAAEAVFGWVAAV